MVTIHRAAPQDIPLIRSLALEVFPAPCRMELNVNRSNKALSFYEHMGMRKLREGDFPIGGGYFMNDYILGLEIE